MRVMVSRAVAVIRALALMSVVGLCGCASQKLALAPPPGVDFSGRWLLNEAESDDPMRLVTSGNLDQQSRARRGRGRGDGFGADVGVGGPVMPGVGALGDGLRWPGKTLEIKQVAGVVSLSSGGINEVYTPRSLEGKPRHREPRDRDMPARDRGEGPPAQCGWDDKTLVVQGGEPDDDHPPYEKRYSLLDDGQRLVEVIGFKGGRSGGFTMSRTWDRAAP